MFIVQSTSNFLFTRARLKGPFLAAASSIFSCIFSQTLGTATNLVGRTAFRFSTCGKCFNTFLAVIYKAISLSVCPWQAFSSLVSCLWVRPSLPKLTAPEKMFHLGWAPTLLIYSLHWTWFQPLYSKD
jgi:hypothetical protein